MNFCPIPFNDEARARSLSNVPGLTGSEHPAVKAICDATRLLFDCPAAIVTAMNAETQWLVSAAGTERQECCRRDSLCSFTIMSDDVLVVPDLSRDARFAAHSKVSDGGPKFRFYVGVPLILSSGFRLGSLCAFDTKPHDMPQQSHLDILRKLGDAVVAALEKPPEATLEDDGDIQTSNFATLVGHELRTPMTVVLGGLGLLKHATKDSPANPLAAKALKATQHLNNLIETIIRYSIAATGELVANDQTCSLNSIVSDTIDIVSITPEAQRKTIVFQRNLDKDRVRVDRDHIGASLAALLLNAVLHGGDRISICTRIDDDRNVRIDVEDDGNLDLSVELSELYRPFVVGGDLARRGTKGGMGLGLPLTRKLIELHGGKFEVTASTDRTVASILLPMWRIAE